MPKNALRQAALLRLSERRKPGFLPAGEFPWSRSSFIYTYIRETQLDAHAASH